jgi:serine/threonine-protein kinase RIO1
LGTLDCTGGLTLPIKLGRNVGEASTHFDKRTKRENMTKPKRTAAEQVEDEAARKALNPLASRQTISDLQAEPEFQENHKRLKVDRLARDAARKS